MTLRLLQSPQARSMLSYWRRHFQPHGAAELPSPCGAPVLIPRRLEVAHLAREVSEPALLCAWLIVLSRMTERRELTIGIGLDGRQALSCPSFIGCLQQYLPLTATVSWQTPATQLLSSLHNAHAMHARLQNSFTWELLLDDPDCPESAPPLRYQFASHVLPAIHPDCDVVDAWGGGEPFLLKLSHEQVAAGPRRVHLYYDGARVSDSQAWLLADSIATVAHELSVRPGATVSELRLWSAKTHSATDSNSADARNSDPLLSPWRGACSGFRVRQDDGVVEGVDILARAARRAQFLSDIMRLQAEQVVAIGLPHSVEALITLLAAIRCGLPFVWIDPEWPASRQQQLLDTLHSGVWVVPEPVSAMGIGFRPLTLGELTAAEANLSIAAGRNPLHPAGDACTTDQAAYVTFTASTSECPKPLVMSRGALHSRLAELIQHIPRQRELRVLARTAPECAAALWEMLLPVYLGGELCIRRHFSNTDITALVAEVRRQSITLLHVTPAILHALLAHPQAAACESLAVIISSGDRLTTRLVSEFHARFTCTLLNVYGPSGSCMTVETDRAGAAAGFEIASAPLGNFMPHSGHHLLTTRLDPTLEGTVGHLYVGGVSAPRGYVADRAATAAAFIPDPFASAPGARLYRSGDLGRQFADGRIELLGRARHRIVNNTLCFDPAVVEAHLLQLPEVSQALLLPPGDTEAGALVAVIATAGEPRVIESEARAHLSATLPAAAQPARYLCLRELPLTAADRVDVMALRQLALSTYGALTAAPSSPTELAVAEVWCSVLQRESLGAHEDFFLSGGHSLMFVQTITRLRERLSVEIPLKAVFLHPTIATLAAYIDSVRDTPPG